MAPTAATLAASVAMQTRRGPMRSRSGPLSAFAPTYGAISAKATSPVWAALPVVVRTNQGMATMEMRVPVSEIVSAASQPTSGTRRLTGPHPG
jgi:hypothetical protein